MATLAARMLGAAKLTAATYEEVEADMTATPQSMLVVVLASIAGGAGAIRATGVAGLLLAALASLIGWYLWAFVTLVLARASCLAPRRRRISGNSFGPSASRPLRA